LELPDFVVPVTVLMAEQLFYNINSNGYDVGRRKRGKQLESSFAETEAPNDIVN
jgi:hypothetical protein